MFSNKFGEIIFVKPSDSAKIPHIEKYNFLIDVKRMKNLLTTSLIIFVFGAISALGQAGISINKLEKVSDDERNFLRQGFNLPGSALILETKYKTIVSKLAPNANLKICLESIIDEKVREDVFNQVGEWNKKDDIKFGKIEITPNAIKADITIVRYLRRLPKDDPGSFMTWTDEKGKSHPLIPVYHYFIIRKTDSLEIIWRKVDMTYQEEHEVSAKIIIKELKDLMKLRYKAQKEKST